MGKEYSKEDYGPSVNECVKIKVRKTDSFDNFDLEENDRDFESLF